MVQFEWVWMDGETVMETAVLAAYKDDNLITVSGTTIQGLEFSLDDIAEYCKTLKVSL